MRSVFINEVIDQSRFNKFYRNIIVICMLTSIFDGFDLNCFSLVIPSLMADWHLSPVQVGWLGSYGFAGMILGSFAFGPIAEWIGRKRAIIAATTIYCIFTVAVGFARGVTEFAVYRFIAGMGLAGAFPLVVAFTSEYSPKPIRSRLVVWVTSGQAIGTVVATLVGLALLAEYGWRVMFYVAAVPLLVVIWQCFLPESLAYYLKTGKKEKIAQVLVKANPEFALTAEDDYKLTCQHAGKDHPIALFKAGEAKNTILLWIMMIANYVFTFGIVVWLPKLMTLQGWSLNFSLWFTLVWNAGFVVGIPLSGWAQDKFGGRRTLLAIMVMIAAFTSILGTITTPMLLSVMVFFTGACQHAMMGVSGSYIAQNYSLTIRATGTTWGYGVGRIGGIIGPMVGGVLLANQISVPMNFIVFACVPLVSALAVMLTTDRSRVTESKLAIV
ncbi:MFS transporter [Sporomusa acidovorans]|uniref:4-hydroxybenzoate transporter PcaK n=1 Tax=Sporomusa acidovorans (strain ATCC 49682 / DSM 3132 / Mol) TaxID=1123286 RepID=A0ABZ3IZ10_SPOA4|nr:MFS transporter [Sporomusa acidovorans]OZC14207.1 gentisate transporter [Sporomusa acidovorans DSM 3132]SDE71220.1 MFS transporter, AAHS family, benzoate transport protein [Sporomusa acidovorans]